MMVWSSNPFCRTQSDKDSLLFGESFTTDGPALAQVVAIGEKYRNETSFDAAIAPKTRLYMINQDLPEQEYKV